MTLGPCPLCGRRKEMYWLYCPRCAVRILKKLGISSKGMPMFVHLPKVVPASADASASITRPQTRKALLGFDPDDD